MPALQRFLFRTITKILSGPTNSISSIPGLRTFMKTASGPLILPRGVSLQPIRADGVAAEWLMPATPLSQTVILYFHGGAWTLGLYNNHRAMLAYFCRAASCRILLVDYRLAPEHPFPAALDDCVCAYRWLVNNGISPQQMVLAGDSAGGNLVLTTLMTLRNDGDPLPAGSVCISPMTDLACTGASFQTKNDALLDARFASSMARLYAGTQDLCLPLISPHYANLSGLPRLLIQAGEDEILLSDATRLADNARAAGVDVSLSVWQKMWHEWHMFVPYLPEAKQAFTEIEAFIRESVLRANTPRADDLVHK